MPNDKVKISQEEAVRIRLLVLESFKLSEDLAIMDGVIAGPIRENNWFIGNWLKDNETAQSVMEYLNDKLADKIVEKALEKILGLVKLGKYAGLGASVFLAPFELIPGPSKKDAVLDGAPVEFSSSYFKKQNRLREIWRELADSNPSHITFPDLKNRCQYEACFKSRLP